MQDLSGRKLGNYELRERLGRGGMAEVYKAYQGGMDRFVAIKVMLGHLASDESFIERFKREAQAVGKLRHAHIVQIFDFGIENDVYYMAMEFIQGRTLKDYIAQHKRLPVQDALFIMRQLADGLDYAHKSGMIHRDLKPANVMFINEDKQEVVLTDFGIARIMGASGLTGTGMAVGTPAYMSPEAGRGETTDERADIYALGIMLYEMVTGQTPYDADTPLAVIMKHINAPLPTRKDFGEIIPENVERLVLKCLAKDPEDRFETAGAFRDAIDNVIKDLRHHAVTKPVDVSHEDKPTMMAKSASDDKATEAVMTAQSKTAPQTQSSNMGIIAIVGIVVLAILAFGAFQIFGVGQDSDGTEVAQSEEALEAATDNTAVVPSEEVAATDAPDTVAAEASAEATTNSEYPLTLGGIMPPHPNNLNVYSGISPLMDEIDSYIIAGNWDEALAILDSRLEANAENFSALFARSQYYSLRWDDTQQDIADANALIALAPDSEWGYVALADANLNYPDQSTDAAREAIEEAYALAPNNPHVMWRHNTLTATDDQSRDEGWYAAEAAGAGGYRFMSWFGDYLMNTDDYERALPYEETIMRYGIVGSYDRELAFWNVISALILLDRADEAYAIFTESGIMDEADNYSLYSDAAYVAYRAGDFEQAREWAATATALSGEAYAAQYVQALLMGYVDGNVDGAVAQLVSLGGSNLWSRFINWDFQEDINLSAARILGEADRFEEALTYYNLTMENYSYEAWLYEERADAYLEVGDVNAAREDLQQAVNIVDDAEYRRELLGRLTDLGPAPTSTPEPTETPEPEPTEES